MRLAFKITSAAVILQTALILCGCGKKSGSLEESAPAKGTSAMDIKQEIVGRTADGTDIAVFALTNKNGLKARVMTYGATLVSLELPDRNGKLDDVTLGFDSLEGYLGEHPYFGSTVGRYANRIAKGRFALDGAVYALAKNNGENHLHGGLKGFNRVVWKGEPFRDRDASGVAFSYLSKDGEEGYPGNLLCAVVYRLTDNDELKISYQAETDKATPVNLTHHGYFNFAGQGNGDILGHELEINADKYTPVDDGLIPTGELRDVKGSPMDFTRLTKIGSRIADVKGGYDHNYVLRSGGGKLAFAARVVEPTSGRIMEVFTTEPGLQFYSGNFLDGKITGKAGNVYQKQFGFCLETQHFPDSPNKPDFPSTILRPGRKYSTETVFRFSAR